MKECVPLCTLLIVFSLLCGCSTTGESQRPDSHEETLTPAASPDPGDEFFFPDDDDQYKDKNGLYITSHPQGAKVYLDTLYAGTTPVFIQGLDVGNYRVKILLPGYYPHTTRLFYPGEYEVYKVALLPITGSLDIALTPEDASVSIDGEPVNTGLTHLKTGTYTFIARKFGYNDYKTIVTIRENETTYVRAELSEADFSITPIILNRKIFNPRNPGGLGKTEISFFVSSFGSGTITIFNALGEEVFSHSIPSFRTWRQEIIWNGRTGDGKICGDGDYTIRITAQSERSGELHTALKTLTIDSTLTISFRHMWSGLSGLSYVPSAEILPRTSFQIASFMNIHTREIENEWIMQAPSLLSLRMGIGFHTEISFLASLIFSDSEPLPFAVSAGAKKQVVHIPGSLSLTYTLSGKITYHTNTGEDTFTNYTGFSVGSPLQIGLGPFSVLLSPEIILSPYRITHSTDFDEDIDFNMWAYGRWGILFDTGTIVAGISGAIRTSSFTGGDEFGILYPLPGALELSYMLPSSNTYVTITVATEYESSDNYNFMGGFGLGFIY